MVKGGIAIIEGRVNLQTTSSRLEIAEADGIRTIEPSDHTYDAGDLTAMLPTRPPIFDLRVKEHR